MLARNWILFIHHILDLDHSSRINRPWICKDLKSQTYKHDLRVDPTGGNFFVAVKSLDANIAISDNDIKFEKFDWTE